MPPPPDPLWRVVAHGRERHPPGERWWFDNRDRAYQHCVVQVALAGRMRLIDAAGEHVVAPGQAALFRHGAATSYGLPATPVEPFVTTWIGLGGAGLDEHWDGLVALRGPVIPLPEDSPLFAAMQQLAALADPRQRTPPADMARAVHGFVMRLWEDASAARVSALRPVEQAIEAMLAAPTAPWSLKRLAEEHGVSREHLARAFHARMGEPPAAWLAAQRVRRAIALITGTDLPLGTIRDQAGFASTHTLIRRVRAIAGCSPGELRRRR